MSIKLKNTDVVCWVPSAGPDFKSILNWRMGRENKFKPNVFLFTDSGYQNDINEGYENCKRDFERDFENYACSLKIYDSLYFSDKEIQEIGVVQNDQFYHMSPEIYLHYLDIVLNGVLLDRVLRLNGQKIWIDGALDLVGKDNIVALGPVAGISGFINIKKTNLTKDDILDVKVNLIITDEDKQVSIVKKGIACISFDDIKIIILPFSNNETFYECAIRNELRIDCLYAKNTLDDFEYLDSMATIGVKEAMLGIASLEVENLIVRKNEQNYIRVGEKFRAECSVPMGDVDYVQLYKLR